MSDFIEVKGFTFQGTRQVCTCGHHVEKFDPAAKDSDGNVFCRQCIKDGIDKSLAKAANEELERAVYCIKTSERLRAAIGKYKIPTAEEFIDAYVLQQADTIAFHDKMSPTEAAAEAVKQGYKASVEQWFADKEERGL